MNKIVKQKLIEKRLKEHGIEYKDAADARDQYDRLFNGITPKAYSQLKPKEKKHTGHIRRSRVDAWVNALLNYARTEAGKIYMGEIEIEDLIKAACVSQQRLQYNTQLAHKIRIMYNKHLVLSKGKNE